MAKFKIALNPKHPERLCWGCEKLCAANDLRCGNGTIRTQHPVELFGEDWIEWELGDQGAEGRQTIERTYTKPCVESGSDGVQ